MFPSLAIFLSLSSPPPSHCCISVSHSVSVSSVSITALLLVGIWPLSTTLRNMSSSETWLREGLDIGTSFTYLDWGLRRSQGEIYKYTGSDTFCATRIDEVLLDGQLPFTLYLLSNLTKQFSLLGHTLRSFFSESWRRRLISLSCLCFKYRAGAKR